MTYQREIAVSTSGHGEMKDIGAEVGRLVSGSGIVTGTANVFVVGSTAAVGAIELEPGLARDLPETLDRLVPAQPRLRPRAGMARRQRPFPPASHLAGTVG